MANKHTAFRLTLLQSRKKRPCHTGRFVRGARQRGRLTKATQGISGDFPLEISFMGFATSASVIASS